MGYQILERFPFVRKFRKKFLTNDTGLENVSEKRNDGKIGEKVIPRKVLLLFRKISSVMNCSI